MASWIWASVIFLWIGASVIFFWIGASVVSCQLTPLSGSCPSDCDVNETCGGMYKVTCTPTSRGPHQLRVRVGGIEIPGSPLTVSVSPSPAMRGTPVRTITGLSIGLALLLTVVMIS